MGRPTKKGLGYFPLDTDLFSDLKIRKLLHNKGSESLSVYCSALCMVYREGYYLKGVKELAFIIAEEVRLREARVQDILDYCLCIGLFDKTVYREHEVLTSKGIQARYAEICKQMKRTACISEYNLLGSQEGVSSEETQVNSEETLISSEFSTQKKIKEKKKEISSSLPSPTVKAEEVLEEDEDILFFKDYFEKQTEAEKCMSLFGMRQDAKRDGMPILRFLTDSDRKSQCVSFISKWPATLPLYELRQKLEAMERNGQIKPMSYEAWTTISWIKSNLILSEIKRIVERVKSGNLETWETLVSVVKTCKSGTKKIEKPGCYILKCISN